MTVNQSLHIQEDSIEIENQSSIKLVNPNNIVLKRFTEVHYEVLVSIIERVSELTSCSSSLHIKSRVQSYAHTLTISSVDLMLW